MPRSDRAKSPLAALCLLVVCAPAARAQVDAGPIPPTCGSLDARGACFGDVAVYCSRQNDDGSAASAVTFAQRCDDLHDDGGARCAVLDGFGAWCVLPEGGRCALTSGDARAQFACLPNDGGADPAGACDLVEGCVEGVGACAPEAGAPRACTGDRLVVGCAAFGQALTFGCGALGGACEDAACRGLPAGAPCDDEDLRCAPDLACVRGAQPSQRFGACVPAPAAVAPRVDGGEPAPAPPRASCGQVGRGGAAPLALFALLVARARTAPRRRARR